MSAPRGNAASPIAAERGVKRVSEHPITNVTKPPRVSHNNKTPRAGRRGLFSSDDAQPDLFSDEAELQDAKKEGALTRLREHPLLSTALATHGLKWADVDHRFTGCTTSLLTSFVDDEKKAGLIDLIVSDESEKQYESALTRLQEHPRLLDALAAHGLDWTDVDHIFSARSTSFLTGLLEEEKTAGRIDVIIASESERRRLAEHPAGTTLADDDELETLRAFDLDGTFGPCVGIGRLARWSRAARFGLNPPEEVKDILDSLDDTDPAQQSSVRDELA